MDRWIGPVSICASIFLYLHPSIYTYICLSIHLSIYCICPSIHQSIYVPLFIHQSILPYLYSSIPLSLNPLIPLSIDPYSHLFLYPCIFLSTIPSIHPSIVLFRTVFLNFRCISNFAKCVFFEISNFAKFALFFDEN